jgi:hypothetical protein
VESEALHIDVIAHGQKSLPAARLPTLAERSFFAFVQQVVCSLDSGSFPFTFAGLPLPALDCNCRVSVVIYLLLPSLPILIAITRGSFRR